MLARQFISWLAPLSLMLCLFPSPLRAQDQPPAPSPASDDSVTVLATGPVHEAFAKPTTAAAQAGLIVPKKPPEPIPEEPPDVKPEGQNVQWVPGYWGWDPDRNDFIWISGVWRDIPPGQRWVPGYWAQVDTGWQWVSGFWAPADQQEVPYLPQPPASLDNGPSSPAPDDNSTYVPGSWIYRSDNYVWRPGYWCAAQPGWVWTAANYTWTPAGYCFSPGFWDYPLENRGLLSAPVCFNQPLWNNPGWSFTPSCCVSPASLLSSCFVWPQYGHYCFGNYYGNNYARLGIQPWLNWGPRWHDSLFGYYRWAHRGDNWLQNQRALFAGRENGSLWRPGRTLAEQNNVLQRFNNTNIRNTNITNNAFNQRNNIVGNHNTLQTLASFNNVRNHSGFPNVRLTNLNQAQRGEHLAAARGLNQLSQARLRTEHGSTPLRPGQGAPRFRLPPVAHTVQGNRGGAISHNPGQRPSNVARPGSVRSPSINRTPGAVSRPTTVRQGPANVARSTPGRTPSVNRTPGTANRPTTARPVTRAPVRSTAATRPAATPAPGRTPSVNRTPGTANRPTTARPVTRAPVRSTAATRPAATPAARTPAPRATPRPAARPAPRTAAPPAARSAARPAAQPAPVRTPSVNRTAGTANRPATTRPVTRASARPTAAPRPAPRPAARTPAPRATPRPAARPTPRPAPRPATPPSGGRKR